MHKKSCGGTGISDPLE
ncbi:hypothetical protein C5167_047403 [Papaver somniferum]|uniref:Uncharacterized protein n=1 Tax=Papaver somniferum TaxID=3469 RepID=A0A4Y7LH96_PAPSO|nr:hypothetical protein C5167_047403 [Papaver somniferum]